MARYSDKLKTVKAEEVVIPEETKEEPKTKRKASKKDKDK